MANQYPCVCWIFYVPQKLASGVQVGIGNFTPTIDKGGASGMLAAIEVPINAKAEQIRSKFQELLDKTNKENPQPKDVKALAELLSGNRKLELWRDVGSAGYLAELMVIENARATAAVK